jgi:hypothetical protein
MCLIMDKQLYINRSNCIDEAMDRYRYCLGFRKIFDAQINLKISPIEYKLCKSQFQIDLQKCKLEYKSQRL